MGKKNVKRSDPESLKNAGNKAFQIQKYEEALKHFTDAIELSPTSIYYANRANTYLMMQGYDECIKDCDESIKLDGKYIKAYYRKAKAQMCQQKYDDGLATLKTALEKESANEDILALQNDIKEEIVLDNKVPASHPDKVNFAKYKKSMVENEGMYVNKYKVRWENEYIKYAVATEDIKRGELLLAIPNTLWLPLESLVDDTEGKVVSPLCVKLNAHFELTKKLTDPWRNQFFSIFVAEQKKLGENSKFNLTMKSMPSNMNNFPVLFGEKEMELLKGS